MEVINRTYKTSESMRRASRKYWEANSAKYNTLNLFAKLSIIRKNYL